MVNSNSMCIPQPANYRSGPPNLYQSNDNQQQRPIIYGGMVPVNGPDEVLKYPVQPGVCVHFKDENADYIYTKTQGFSQMEKPILEAYELNKVDFESLLPENKKLANYVTVDQMSELTSVISQLTQEVMSLKNGQQYYKPKHHEKRRDDYEQKKPV